MVAAIDINTVANEVYKYNFPHTQLLAKTIEVSNNIVLIRLYIARKIKLNTVRYWFLVSSFEDKSYINEKV